MIAEENWYTVRSLLSISVDAVSSCLELHTELVKTLPPFLKNRVLSVATKRGNLSNKVLKCLLHPNIIELDLSENSVCNGTLKILSVCKQLRKLDLNPGRNQLRNFHTEALIELFPSLPNLMALYMRRCSAVNDDVISALVNYCPLLRELDVGGCYSITDDSLKYLKDLMNLTSLNVSSSQVSDGGIMALVEGNCGETLTELRLDWCHGITDCAIEAIVLFCSNMKLLIFHGCPVTDASWFALEQLLSKSEVKQLTWTIY